jgi:hypothetical protein
MKKDGRPILSFWRNERDTFVASLYVQE